MKYYVQRVNAIKAERVDFEKPEVIFSIMRELKSFSFNIVNEPGNRYPHFELDVEDGCLVAEQGDYIYFDPDKLKLGVMEGRSFNEKWKPIDFPETTTERS